MEIVQECGLEATTTRGIAECYVYSSMRPHSSTIIFIMHGSMQNINWRAWIENRHERASSCRNYKMSPLKFATARVHKELHKVKMFGCYLNHGYDIASQCQVPLCWLSLRSKWRHFPLSSQNLSQMCYEFSLGNLPLNLTYVPACGARKHCVQLSGVVIS